MASNVVCCNYCGARFTSLQELSEHEEIHRALAFLNGEIVPPFETRFPCNQCHCSYDLKGNLTRHVNTKHMGSKYSCSICEKKFTRLDNKKRHEKTCKGRDHVCVTCGKRCSTDTGLKRHEKVHQKPPKSPPRTKNKIPTKSASRRSQTSAPRRQPTCYRCRRCDATFSDRHHLYLHGMQHHYQIGRGLQQRPWEVPPWRRPDGTLDDQLREVYEANQPIILEEDRPGPIQSTYNFPVGNDISVAQLNRVAGNILNREQWAFKLKLSVGVILQNRETGQYRYYTPFVNNTLLDSPVYISSSKDLSRLDSRLQRLDVLNHLMRDRPDTKWIPVLVTNVHFYVTATNYPLGQGHLPDYLLKTFSIYPLIKNQHNGKPYDDNLCLFRCLALHRGHEVRCIDGPARDYYQQWKQHQKPKEPFSGVSLDEFPEFESFFKVDLEVYNLLEEGEVRSVFRSRARYNNSMYVNMHENHASYIRNFSTYANKFRCDTCDRHFNRAKYLKKHQNICTGKTKYVYPGGFHKTTESVFETLDQYNIHVPEQQRNFPWFICYDFESVLQKIEVNSTQFLSWTEKHFPISVSICSNAEDHTQPFCIVEPDQNDLVEYMVTSIKEIADKVAELAEGKWGWVLEKIQEKIDKKDFGSSMTELMGQMRDESEEEEEEEEEEKEDTSEAKRLQKLYGQMEAYMKQVPVLGFNSAKYDLNLIKKTLTRHLQMHEEERAFIIKKQNSYACISCPQLKFLDMSQFLAPGSSYAGFLKAYGVTMQKGYFPYQWFDTVEKLNITSLPSHEDFHSTLKNSNISDEEYQYCQQVWKDNNMQSFKEFLVWYNNLDVGPFVEAVKNFQNFYFDKGVDVFKTAISVPGIARQLLFRCAKEENANFVLCDRNNADLYQTIKANIVGGPAIIFNRRHKAGETKIRGGKTCKSVLGFDANALYLWAIDQPMPVGPFVRRFASNNFKPEVRDRFMSAFYWMEWLMFTQGIRILHQQNHGFEIKVGKYPVDGFQPASKEGEKAKIYQFHGCFWHGHRCHLTKGVKDPKWHETRKTKYQKTKRITEYLRKKASKVIEMWECQFQMYCKRNPKIYDFINSKRPGFFQKFKGKAVTEADILKGVKDGDLFGMVEVNIEVPEHWPTDSKRETSPYEYFREMSPLFCTTEVAFENFGQHMQKHVEEHNLSKVSRRLLIGGMKAQQILLATPLLKWYLRHDMKVTKVNQVVEFREQRCFSNFVQEVSEARRQGDSDPSTAIIADTMKLIGCSAYGSLIMDKSKHRDMQYIQGENETCLKVNEPRF